MDVKVLTVILFSGWIFCVRSDRSSEKSSRYKDMVFRTQCEAGCLKEFGKRSADDTDTIYNTFQHHVCVSNTCNKCLSMCNTDFNTMLSCPDLCDTPTCLHLCQELEIRLNGVMEIENDWSSVGQQLRLTTPTVVCKDIPPVPKKCRRHPATVYLKWQVDSKPDTFPVLFVVSVRQRENASQQPLEWVPVLKTPNAFVPVGNLSCDSLYQFRVTMVTSQGIAGVRHQIHWEEFAQSNGTLSAPTGLRVEKLAILNFRPSAIVTWDAGQNPGCFYSIYWMSDSQYQDNIKAPPEFRYRIRQLKFASNYTVELVSSNRRFRNSSEKVTMTFLTPECLTSTNYNNSLCPPLAPNNVTWSPLTDLNSPDIMLVNITVTWQPPEHTHQGADVVFYKMSFKKEVPIHAGHLISAHFDDLYVNGSETSVVLRNLHYYNIYIVSLYAVTEGGIGKPAVISIPLGLDYLDVYGVDDNVSNTAVSKINLNTEELVLITVIPCVLSIVFLITCLVLCRHRIRHKHLISHRRYGPVEQNSSSGIHPVQAASHDFLLLKQETNPIYDRMASPPQCSRDAVAAKDEFEIDMNDLNLIRVVGEGAFGKVYKAEFHAKCDNKDRKIGDIVAVKVLKDFSTGEELRGFLLEMEALKKLGQHPCIVSMLGCCLTGPKFCIVMDYCPLGDLRNYLRVYREKLLYGSQTKGLQDELGNDNNQTESLQIQDDFEAVQEDISEAQLLSYARQIAIGMEFLEEKKYIHRDLAARNILLYDHTHVKISDFGLTRYVYEINVYQPTSARKLPYKWMAIEALFNQCFTIKTDIWSFGVVLWEIVTLGGSPYPSIPLKDLYGLLRDGYRMEKPENCSPKIYQIMLSCWHPNPHNRPGFKQLKHRLETLLEETQPYIDLSVEVSHDYFSSNSLSGSSASVVDDGCDGDASTGAYQTYLKADVHSPYSDPQKDSPEEFRDSGTCTDILEDSGNSETCRYCRFDMTNTLKDSVSEGQLPGPARLPCTCVLCLNHASSSSKQTETQPLKQKHSVKESLRLMFDKMGNAAVWSTNRTRKRSISMTEVRSSQCSRPMLLSAENNN